VWPPNLSNALANPLLADMLVLAVLEGTSSFKLLAVILIPRVVLPVSVLKSKLLALDGTHLVIRKSART